MRRHSIDITGAGDHVVIASQPGKRIIVSRLLLTFSHANNHALKMLFKSGSTALAGPFYILDGADINYYRGAGREYDIGIGEDFIINLSDGLSAAGMAEYEIGGIE